MTDDFFSTVSKWLTESKKAVPLDDLKHCYRKHHSEWAAGHEGKREDLANAICSEWESPEKFLGWYHLKAEWVKLIAKERYDAEEKPTTKQDAIKHIMKKLEAAEPVKKVAAPKQKKAAAAAAAKAEVAAKADEAANAAAKEATEQERKDATAKQIEAATASIQNRLAANEAEAAQRAADAEETAQKNTAALAASLALVSQRAEEAEKREADAVAEAKRLAQQHADEARARDEAQKQRNEEAKILAQKHADEARARDEAEAKEAKIRHNEVITNQRRDAERGVRLAKAMAAQRKTLNELSITVLDYSSTLNRKVDALISGDHAVRIRYFVLVPQAPGVKKLNPKTWLNDAVCLVPLYPNEQGELVPSQVTYPDGFVLREPKAFVKKHKRLIKISMTLLKVGIGAAGAQVGVKVGNLDMVDLNFDTMDIGELLAAADLPDEKERAVEVSAIELELEPPKGDEMLNLALSEMANLQTDLDTAQAKKLTREEYTSLKKTMDENFGATWEQHCGLDEPIEDPDSNDVPILWLPRDDPRIKKKNDAKEAEKERLAELKRLADEAEKERLTELKRLDEEEAKRKADDETADRERAERDAARLIQKAFRYKKAHPEEKAAKAKDALPQVVPQALPQPDEKAQVATRCSSPDTVIDVTGKGMANGKAPGTPVPGGKGSSGPCANCVVM